MSKQKNRLYPDDLPEGTKLISVDVGKQMGLSKEVISQMVFYEGREFWQAEHFKTGIYFTDNPKDPKILNYANSGNPRPRGNLRWTDGGGNPSGRPKDSKNRVSVRAACEKLDANPAEMIAALMSSDLKTLRKYGIKDPKNVTIAQKLKCAEILLNKLVPNLKPADLGEDGEAVVSKEVEELNKPQIQVYLPSSGKTISFKGDEKDIAEIEDVGVEQYIKNHQKETLPFDSENEDDNFVWQLKPEK